MNFREIQPRANLFCHKVNIQIKIQTFAENRNSWNKNLNYSLHPKVHYRQTSHNAQFSPVFPEYQLFLKHRKHFTYFSFVQRTTLHLCSILLGLTIFRKALRKFADLIFACVYKKWIAMIVKWHWISFWSNSNHFLQFFDSSTLP